MNAKQQKQLEENSKEISEIKSTLHTISTNHLWHIEKDMASMDKRVEKLDTKIWAVLIMLVASSVFAFIGDKF